MIADILLAAYFAGIWVYVIWSTARLLRKAARLVDEQQ